MLAWLTRIVSLLLFAGVIVMDIQMRQYNNSGLLTTEVFLNMMQSRVVAGALAVGLMSTLMVLTAPAPKFRYGTAGIIWSFGLIWLAFSGKQFAKQDLFGFRAPVHLLIAPLCLIVLGFLIFFHAWYTFKYRVKPTDIQQQPQSQP